MISTIIFIGNGVLKCEVSAQRYFLMLLLFQSIATLYKKQQLKLITFTNHNF